MSRLRRSAAALLATLVVVGIGVFAIQSPAHAGYYVSSGPLFGPYSIRTHDGAGNPKCLDVKDVSQLNGARLQTWDCYGTWQNNQQFYFWDIEGSSYYQITPSHSWKCLDVQGVSHTNYAPIQQYDCLGANQLNQVWDVWFDSRPGWNAWHIVSVNSWRHMAFDYPVNGAAVYQLNQDYLWSLCVGDYC